jgi:hypothetical protein
LSAMVHLTHPRKRKKAHDPRAPPVPVDPKHPVGWVYFAVAGDRIKIGHSRRLAKRMQVLHSSSPGGATLLGVIAGGAGVEANVHEYFDHLREHGEWFRDHPGLRAYIEKHCDPIEAHRAIVVERAGVRRPA